VACRLHESSYKIVSEHLGGWLENRAVAEHPVSAPEGIDSLKPILTYAIGSACLIGIVQRSPIWPAGRERERLAALLLYADKAINLACITQEPLSQITSVRVSQIPWDWPTTCG